MLCVISPLIIMKLHTLAPNESMICPIEIEVQRSRSYRRALVIENCFQTISDTVINIWPWIFMHMFPMSQWRALLILGLKGQRLRPWRLMIENGFLTITMLFIQDHEASYILSLWVEDVHYWFSTRYCFLAHLSRRLEWAIVIAHRPSGVKFSHFRLLFQNRLMDFDETW